MTQYWWVNHKQTGREEIDGKYLWSPKATSNGARNEFYNNMRRANPGDVVLSFIDAQIRHVGRVAEFAFTAPKPEEFGETGAYWNSEGWLLPVFWTPLEFPVRPSQIMDQLGRLLPDKYSPIDPTTGHGRQGAYLAPISKEIFDVVIAGVSFDSDMFARGGENSLTFGAVKEILEDIEENRIRADTSLNDTVRKSVIQARRGQGKFRSNVEANGRSCRLTGITNPALLIASHIKPWRLCSSAQERLDGWNGLMLTPDADRLFDRGFITFEDNGNVRVSSRVPSDDLRRLGFEQLAMQRFGVSEAPPVWQTGGLENSQRDYMGFHRKGVFVDEM